MSQLETGEASEAAHGNSDSRRELAEVHRQRAAISEVLRVIASSPHDLQPILQTIIDSAMHLCRAEFGIFRLFEGTGFRLAAYKLSPEMVYSPPVVRDNEPDSIFTRLYASKSPVHIPDIAAQFYSMGEADRSIMSKTGVRTILALPMLRSDELIGSLVMARQHVEPFMEKDIELAMDFAAQAAIVLENTRRERQLRELQMQLAHTNRVVTIGQLTASITHEVKQPIAAVRNYVSAALNFLNRNPADLQKVREALAHAVKDTERADAVVSRMRAMMQNVSTRTDRVDINEAVREVIELSRGEALKNKVSVETQFAEDLPIITGDRVQLQQVVLNLTINALQAMGAVNQGTRQLLITTRQIELNDLCIGVQDTGPGLSADTLSRLFEPFYTTKPNGMGMGLAICRSIVEAHGGRVWASTCEPHGALFQFTIPARLA